MANESSASASAGRALSTRYPNSDANLIVSSHTVAFADAGLSLDGHTCTLIVRSTQGRRRVTAGSGDGRRSAYEAEDPFDLGRRLVMAARSN
jgi:hypothetical protein